MPKTIFRIKTHLRTRVAIITFVKGGELESDQFQTYCPTPTENQTNMATSGDSPWIRVCQEKGFE